MATAGDNAIWLCRNHHKLFDMLAYTYIITMGYLLYFALCNLTNYKAISIMIYSLYKKELRCLKI